MQKLGETKMVSSCAYCHAAVCLTPSHPPPRPLSTVYAQVWVGCHPAKGLWRCVVAAGAGTRQDRQVGTTQPCNCPRFSHRSDPVWSLPPRGINYTTGPDCSCYDRFMAELLQPAPSLAFAHTGTLCSTFNRCRKGTLQEINRLPSTNQSYHLSGLSHQPTSLLPCREEGSPAPRNTNQMCHATVHNWKPQVHTIQHLVEHMVGY